MIAMFSQGDKFCSGAHTDPASVTDPALFVSCLRDAFALICGEGDVVSANEEERS